MVPKHRLILEWDELPVLRITASGTSKALARSVCLIVADQMFAELLAEQIEHVRRNSLVVARTLPGPVTQ